MPAHVASIVFSPQPGSFNRHALPEAMLLAGFGIDGDLKGGRPNRNLNIMDQEMLDSGQLLRYLFDPYPVCDKKGPPQ